MIQPCVFCREPGEMLNNSRTQMPHGRVIPASTWWGQCTGDHCRARGPRRMSPVLALDAWNRQAFFGVLVASENAAFLAENNAPTEEIEAADEVLMIVDILEEYGGFEGAPNAGKIVQLANLCAAAQRYAEMLLVYTPLAEVEKFQSE